MKHITTDDNGNRIVIDPFPSKEQSMLPNYQKRTKSDRSSIRADNMTPKRVFFLVNRRIEWLNERIAVHQADGRPYIYFIEERESLIWMQDKLEELLTSLVVCQNNLVVCQGEINRLDKELKQTSSVLKTTDVLYTG